VRYFVDVLVELDEVIIAVILDLITVAVDDIFINYVLVFV
jgi:hypothetical protein